MFLFNHRESKLIIFLLLHIGKASRKMDQSTEHDMYADFPTVAAPLMPGGYTSLLLGVDQEASAARKLHFDEAHKQ
jgi:hypothetical protein